MDLNQRVAEALKYTGVSNDELAQSLGVSRNTISSYKSGKGDLKGRVLEGLALNYSFNPIWLLTGQGEMHDESVSGTTVINAQKLSIVPATDDRERQTECLLSIALLEIDAKLKPFFEAMEVFVEMKDVKGILNQLGMITRRLESLAFRESIPGAEEVNHVISMIDKKEEQEKKARERQHRKGLLQTIPEGPPKTFQLRYGEGPYPVATELLWIVVEMLMERQPDLNILLACFHFLKFRCMELYDMKTPDQIARMQEIVGWEHPPPRTKT